MYELEGSWWVKVFHFTVCVLWSFFLEKSQADKNIKAILKQRKTRAELDEIDIRIEFISKEPKQEALFL
jgi:hypothetical protein